MSFRVCLCDHLESAHIGRRCQGTVYDPTGNHSCHCEGYVENAPCVCGMTLYAHRYRREKEPGGTWPFGTCQKFVPYVPVVVVEKYHDEQMRILPKPVVVGTPANEGIEEDPTRIRFSLLELE